MKFAVPTIAMTVFMSFYTMVDGLFGNSTVKKVYEKNFSIYGNGVFMKEKDKLLTIGQFAAMHGINKKTLMWYDEIGLFLPAAVT